MKKARILSVFLSICMIVSCMVGFSVTASAESGNCGPEGHESDVTWTLESGAMTIGGTGPMKEFAAVSDLPWVSLRNQITSVTVTDGVTSVSSIAFYMCQRLETVTIAGSVKTIGEYAFCNCTEDHNGTGIRTVNLSEGLETIGDSAFAGCEYLSSITLPNGLKTIGKQAFEGCAITGDQDGNFIIPDSVTEIGEQAFGYRLYCSFNKFKSVVLPSGLTEIKGYVFDNCDELLAVVIPDNVQTIGIEAFATCIKLTSVTIPKSVTSIGDGAFSYCPELEEVYYGGNKTEWAAIEKGAGYLDDNGDSIVKYNIAACVPENIPDQLFTGSEVKPVVVKDGNNELTEGTDFTIAYTGNIDLGTASATITGMGDYYGNAAVRFNIVENPDPDGNGGHPWAEKPEYKPSGASGTAAPEEKPADTQEPEDKPEDTQAPADTQEPEDTQAPEDTDEPEDTVAPEVEPEPETTAPADVEITTGGTGAVNGGSDEANPHTGAALGGLAFITLAGAAMLVSKKRK